jgi:hypothetical protein
MTSNVINSVAFLRSSREFPEELHQLATEVNRSYIDIANNVNSRIIGIFPVNRPAITGESWFLVNNQKQQGLRQVYTFTSTTSINHGIQVVDPNQFTICSGSYTNGTNSFGLPFGTSTVTPGLITFYITPTQIVFSLGAGAPALTSGRIVLEWISQA